MYNYSHTIMCTSFCHKNHSAMFTHAIFSLTLDGDVNSELQKCHTEKVPRGNLLRIC